MNGWDEGNPKWSIKNQIIHFYKLSAFSNNFYKIPEKSRQIWQMARSNIRLPIWCWLYPEIGETNPCPMSNYRWVKISSIHFSLFCTLVLSTDPVIHFLIGTQKLFMFSSFLSLWDIDKEKFRGRRLSNNLYLTFAA